MEQSSNSINVDFGNLLSEMSVITSSDVTTVQKSTAAINAIDTGMESISSRRSEFGSAVNRLVHAADAMLATKLATVESRSRVEDIDYAIATSELTKAQIIQQAATSVLAQANQSSSSVLALLK